MPYPNEHACRLIDPGKCRKGDENWGVIRRKSATHGGKPYRVIRGRLKSTGDWVEQAYRYPKASWPAPEARAHCKAHKGILFEPASGQQSAPADENCCAPLAAELKAGGADGSRWIRSGLATGLVAGPASVARDENLIEGFSVVTRGEARGHDLWLDDEFLSQVVTAGNGHEPTGLKSRFTHPGLCSDGLGKYLGRARGFSLDGDRVRADLHLSEVAQRSPDGDLYNYVLDLAEADPQAFGASIVFRHDREAEREYKKAHSDEDGQFTSPDQENADNLPHARLASLHSVDVVDEPAANVGFFGRMGESGLLVGAERFLDWALGVSDEVPDELIVGAGVESRRAKAFLEGYLDRRGLQVVPRQNGIPNPAARGGDQREERSMPEELTYTLEELETWRDECRAEGAKAERQRFERLREKFTDRPEFVVQEYSWEHSVEEAEAALRDVIIGEQAAEIERLKQQPPDAETTGAAAAGHSEETTDDFMALTEARAREKGIPFGDAVLELGNERPAMADAWRARQG